MIQSCEMTSLYCLQVVLSNIKRYLWLKRTSTAAKHGCVELNIIANDDDDGGDDDDTVKNDKYLIADDRWCLYGH